MGWRQLQWTCTAGGGTDRVADGTPRGIAKRNELPCFEVRTFKFAPSPCARPSTSSVPSPVLRCGRPANPTPSSSTQRRKLSSHAASRVRHRLPAAPARRCAPAGLAIQRSTRGRTRFTRSVLSGTCGSNGHFAAASGARREIGTDDSLARLQRLKAEFEDNAAKPSGAFQTPVEPGAKTSAWRDHRRVIKAVVGIVLLVVLGWMPVRALLQTTSTEAVVNARLISLRAPIDGEIAQTSVGVSIGSELSSGQTILRIVNNRADRSRLADLRRLIDQLANDREGISARITELTALHGDLSNQVRVFQEGRLRQLTERASELKSELSVASINRDTAAKALARIEPMVASGSITAATLEKYTREARVTAETCLAIEHRLAALEVELQAARRGTFIGDSYNDRPRSSQRVDEVGQRLGELKADLRERDARLITLHKEFADETKHYEESSAADLLAPVTSRVWEMLTAPGESVVRGQDLVRLLDCSGLVVTAIRGGSLALRGRQQRLQTSPSSRARW
jgi:multidrug resistance efflux pump